MWWYKDTGGYAVSKYKNKSIQMHRVITDADESKEVDHINHNKLDNRKANLREVTRTQNNMNHDIRSDNKSGVTGVIWGKQRKKWRSYICVNGKSYHLGEFKDKEDAIKARKQAEKELFGEYSFKKGV